MLDESYIAQAIKNHQQKRSEKHTISWGYLENMNIEELDTLGK